jgi:thiol-disulfide isomerase/thioredoxin
MNLNRLILPLLFAAQTLAAAPTFRNGQWRALLIRKDGNDIAFNFNVKDSAGRQVLYLRNAGERILVDDITKEGDSLFIKFPFYESQLRARVTPEGNLEGVWLRHLADSWLVVPFKAYYGENDRFPGKTPMKIPSIAGRYAAVFRSTTDPGDTTFRVGEFQQSGTHVTGTFLDAGGDLRYLEGAVIGDSLKLSTFDGTHAYYFTATIDGNKLTGGYYYAGVTNVESWTAHKDPNAKLEDQFAMTKWKKNMPFTFTFRDLDGNNVSLSDPRYRNKVVVIQIMGSWCPNCMDETRFLSGFYKEYQSKGVEVIALAYERSTDFPRSQASVRTFQQRFDVKYPMLITGVAVGDPDRAAKTLPQLERIVNFPTTIFVGKSGHIEKIHTGFSGPGTGRHYDDQKQEFYTLVNDLLAAK